MAIKKLQQIKGGNIETHALNMRINTKWNQLPCIFSFTMNNLF